LSRWLDESTNTEMKCTSFSSLRICFAANGAITLVITALHFVCEHVNLSLKFPHDSGCAAHGFEAVVMNCSMTCKCC
jgi:hypothetical protein